MSFPRAAPFHCQRMDVIPEGLIGKLGGKSCTHKLGVRLYPYVINDSETARFLFLRTDKGLRFPEWVVRSESSGRESVYRILRRILGVEKSKILVRYYASEPYLDAGKEWYAAVARVSGTIPAPMFPMTGMKVGEALAYLKDDERKLFDASVSKAFPQKGMYECRDIPYRIVLQP